MCGIAGFIKAGNQADSSAVLKLMAGTLIHRGPDDEGFYETTTRDREFSIGLAHRRLSIIDLDTGHQPLGNENGSIQIIFNGEIYNFQELRRHLTGAGHEFKTNSDTETIVHAYEAYGEQCVHHLRGMFSFALWDADKEKMFLARDRFGKKPLYLYEQNSDVYFASEIKSLLGCPGVRTGVNLAAVYQYLLYRYVPAPDTLFKGIYKLPPAAAAVWQDGRISTTGYYQPPDRKRLRPIGRIEQPVKQFHSKLEEAVSIRMVSDVPFGAFLSGGIDSSAIVALMTRQTPIPIKTYSIGFPEQQYSELRYAKIIADHFRTDHHELVVSQDHMIDELENLVGFRDAPVSEPSDIPIYLLSKEAGKTVKMVLTGEGSDDVLGGYPKYVFEKFAGPYQIIPGLLRNHFIEPLIRALPYRFRRIKTAVKTLGIADKNERFPAWFGALSVTERRRLLAAELSSNEVRREAWFDTEPGNSSLRNILYFDQTSWLPDNLLERGDRMTMAASLEARMPFLDHELAAFVSGLPDKYRVRGLKTKWILREAVKEILPSRIIDRPKVGFRVPVNEWFQGPMKQYLMDHLMASNAVTRVYYHEKELKKVLDEHAGGRQNHEKLLWTLLNLEIWHRLYRMNP